MRSIGKNWREKSKGVKRRDTEGAEKNGKRIREELEEN
jgi:hypothetical protein